LIHKVPPPSRYAEGVLEVVVAPIFIESDFQVGFWVRTDAEPVVAPDWEDELEPTDPCISPFQDLSESNEWKRPV